MKKIAALPPAGNANISKTRISNMCDYVDGLHVETEDERMLSSCKWHLARQPLILCKMSGPL